MIWGVTYNFVLMACCLYAGLFGKRPERIGAALVFGASMLTWLAQQFAGHNHVGFEAGIFAIDVVMLACLMVLALRVDRFWPLWAAGFHLIGVSTHAAVLANANTAPIAYAHALGIWGYAVLIALAAGTWYEVHLRRHVPVRA